MKSYVYEKFPATYMIYNNWKKNNWKTAAKKEVKNKELWQQLDQLMEHHEVQLHWVKGHSGDAGNEMADLLANKGIDSLT